jgi:hypothetical protein
VAVRVLLTDTSRWSVSARLAIAFVRAGCEVFALCPSNRHPIRYATGVAGLFPYSSVRPLNWVESAIVESRPDIIIPCDERGVRHLHELYARVSTSGGPRTQIAELIKLSLGSPDSYDIVSSRYELLRIAREEGIRTPDTAKMNEADDLELWQRQETLPWVLKADCTYGGAGVEIIRLEGEIPESFSRLKGLYRTKRVLKRLVFNRDPFWLRPWWRGIQPTITAQAYIDGRPANCAVLSWKGKVLAGIAVEVLSSTGQTGPATVVRVIDNPEMMNAAAVLARRLSLSGFFGLDFMLENSTGAAHLIEMNPRCTTLCHLQLGKGRNMVGALVAQLSGRPLVDSPAVTENGTIAYFPQAWTSNDQLLPSSFHDIPQNEPELVEELLRPWPDRTLLYRLGNVLAASKSPKP